MKTAMPKCRALLLPLLLTLVFGNANSLNADTLAFDQILLQLDSEFRLMEVEHIRTLEKLNTRLAAANIQLEATAGRRNRKFTRALETKLSLMEAIAEEQSNWEVEQLKIRYRRGIDLIRLMYEKVLGLDHHFTSLRTYQHISVISNPHSYPEFEQVQESMRKNKNKKYQMNLPGLLESNPFISTTFTLFSLMLGENGKKEKEADVEKISCILDFTVRMNGDLNVIRNETEFLRITNQDLKADLERLFQDYTKPIGYLVPLSQCRTNDDWETLFLKLEERMAEIDVGLSNPEGVSIEASREIVNVEFATQRVSGMIGQYSDFIASGTQYYQKFEGIVSGYEHEEVCEAQLPRQFGELQTDIRSTISKFTNTYDLPELQGSRLKDLMFGISE